MFDVPINYWAVVIAAVVQMVLGFLWYGPLFGKKWMALGGITQQSMEEFKASSDKNKMNKLYATAFVAALVMAYVLAHFLVFAKAYMNTDAITAGLTTGFWAWLGFVAPVTLSSVLWDRKPWMLWVLNNGYWLVSLLLMGLLLSYWM